MNVLQFLKRVGADILDFFEGLAETHREMMEKPTHCQQCQQVYLYKELRPRFFSWVYTTSSPYEQMLRRMLSEAGRPHSYCPTCWKIIYQTIRKKCEVEYRLAVRLPEEARLVETHNERARALGRQATLTVTEWVKTLDYYDWYCAYCKGSYEELEHRVPLVGGGGTVAENCIPSCRSCNRRKGRRHPKEIMERESSLSPEAHRRIQAEMEALHGGVSAVLSSSSHDGQEA